MLTHAFPVPKAIAAIGADVDCPEVLWCATPNTAIFRLSHGWFLEEDANARRSRRSASYPPTAITVL